ncbi:DUF2510 domain-containing protein [Nocardioides montaniterrae]
MQDFVGGWFPDPTGRYARRWYDGYRWTEEVAVDGNIALDALPQHGAPYPPPARRVAESPRLSSTAARVRLPDVVAQPLLQQMEGAKRMRSRSAERRRARLFALLVVLVVAAAIASVLWLKSA